MGPKVKSASLKLTSPYRFILEPSGLGSHYGTLSGPIGHFSAESKPKPPRKAELKNMITNPPKKGTGYGYCGVTLGESLLRNTKNVTYYFRKISSTCKRTLR